jgi:8-oxo-dGTP diphosphatase
MFKPVVATVDVFILKGGKVLLEKRHSGTYAGYWCVPGGHVEVGESVRECVERETFEETGLRVKAGDIMGVYSGRRYPKAAAVSMFFSAQIIGGKIKPQMEEVDELRFFLPDKLPARIAFDHRKLIRDGFSFRRGRRKVPLVS